MHPGATLAHVGYGLELRYAVLAVKHVIPGEQLQHYPGLADGSCRVLRECLDTKTGQVGEGQLPAFAKNISPSASASPQVW